MLPTQKGETLAQKISWDTPTHAPTVKHRATKFDIFVHIWG